MVRTLAQVKATLHSEHLARIEAASKAEIDLAIVGLRQLLDEENSGEKQWCDLTIHWHGIDTIKEYIASVDKLSPMFREFYNTFYGDKETTNE